MIISNKYFVEIQISRYVQQLGFMIGEIAFIYFSSWGEDLDDIKVILNNISKFHRLFTLKFFFGHIWVEKHDFLFKTEPSC